MHVISDPFFSPMFGNKAVVLCYHSISNEKWRFSVTSKVFADHINLLKKNFEIIPLASLGKKMLSNKKLQVALTFDDGYEDNLQNAAPILKKYELPATIFVIGELLHANRFELDNTLSLLSAKQVNQLHGKYGWNIGFHTKSHANLANLTDTELEKEILLGKKKKEKKLAISLHAFAYPKGYFNTKISGLVKRAGFHTAFTVAGTVANFRTPFQISRLNIEGKLSATQLETLLTPTGIVFHYVLTQLIQLKAKIQQAVVGIITSSKV